MVPSPQMCVARIRKIALTICAMAFRNASRMEVAPAHIQEIMILSSGVVALTRLGPYSSRGQRTHRSSRRCNVISSSPTREPVSMMRGQPTRSSVSFKTSNGLVIGHRHVISAFRWARLVGSGSRSSGDTRIHPFGRCKIFTPGIVGHAGVQGL